MFRTLALFYSEVLVSFQIVASVTRIPVSYASILGLLEPGTYPDEADEGLLCREPQKNAKNVGQGRVVTRIVRFRGSIMHSAQIGVVIPAKNEQQHIRRCIESVLAAADGVKLDIIVIDNNSQDDTALIAARSGARVVYSDSSYIGEVRNIGAASVHGEFLAYIDADCEAPACWLHVALTAFENHDVAAVAGLLEVPQNANWVQKSWALPKRVKNKTTRNIVGASFFVRRGVFDGIGGFDPKLRTGEDTDFARRLLEHGLRIQLEPLCNVVHHGYPSTLIGIIDRQIWQVQGQYGRTGFWDRSILAACGFFITLLLIVGSLITKNWSAAVAATVFAALAPVSFMVSRLRRSHYRISTSFILRQYAISVVYLLGRGLGVVIAITRFPYHRSYK